MKVWITTAGHEEYGITNSIWLAANLKGFKPDKVYILTNDTKDVKKVIETAKKLLKEKYGITAVEVDFNEEDFKDYRDKLKIILEKEKSNEIAVDVTHGRKYMCIISFETAFLSNTKRVFYIHLKDTGKYHGKPIDEIPIVNFNIVDLVEELKK